MTVHQRDEVPAATLPKQLGGRQWNWQRTARIAWIVIALLLFTYFVASIPLAYQYVQITCTLLNPVQCSSGQLTPGNV